MSVSDQKKKQIVQAAIAEFQEKGYAGASMDRISERAQVSKRTVYNHFESKDVLCIIAGPKQFTAQQTVSMAEFLNERFMPRDVVILEDHPEISEKVKGVKLNNGEHILFLAQSLSKLNRFSKMLESGPYYKNWSKTYLESVKGFRARKSPKA